MRILVIILIALNMLLLGFGLYAEYQHYVVGGPQKELGQILADLMPDAAFKPAEKKTEPQTSGEITPEASSQQPVKAQQPAAAPEENTETAKSENHQPTLPVENKEEKGSTSVSEKPAPIIVYSPNQQKLSQQPATVSPPQQPDKPAQREIKRLACVEFGPLSQSKVSELRRLIGPIPPDTLFKVFKKTSGSGPFWVYLPSTANLAEQQQQIAMLKQKGVTDYFIVQQSPKDTPAVSLGVFSSEDRAKALHQRMLEKGIPAQLGQKTTGMSYVQLLNAPETIRRLFPDIRKRFPSLTSFGACQP